MPYTLSTDNEVKTVYVWFEEAAGNVSAVQSDVITLDTTLIDVSRYWPLAAGNTYLYRCNGSSLVQTTTNIVLGKSVFSQKSGCSALADDDFSFSEDVSSILWNGGNQSGAIYTFSPPLLFLPKLAHLGDSFQSSGNFIFPGGTATYRSGPG